MHFPPRQSPLPGARSAAMCILCVRKTGAGRAVRTLLSSWQASVESAPRAAGAARCFSSLPEPVGQAAAHPNVVDGKVAHPTLLNGKYRGT